VKVKKHTVATISLTVLILGLAGVPALVSSTVHPQPRKLHGTSPSSSDTTPSTARLAASYGKLPLSFEANTGQTNPAVKFLSHGKGYALFLTGTEAVLSLRQPQPKKPGVRSRQAEKLHSSLRSRERDPDDAQDTPQDTLVTMRLLGANPHATVSGADELPGKANYFVGDDPSKWRTNVPTYERVRYQNVYPGIDLVYYGNQEGQLEYDFVVAAGADPSQIAFNVAAGILRQTSSSRGATVRTNSQGDLVISSSDGELRFHKPVVYQTTVAARNNPRFNRRRFIDARFVLDARNRVHFALGPYDSNQPLVIDPVLSYSTYLGGKNYSLGEGIAVDSSGSAYVTGFTRSASFPTADPLNGSLAGRQNVYVTKFNPAGSALVYSTYLGGNNFDFGLGIALDSSGDAYLTGFTTSTNFPTVNAVQTAFAGTTCAFVSQLNPTGSALIYSTYLGGNSENIGQGIAVDSTGSAYVTGYTSSTNFPTASPLQPGLAGNVNAFVSKLSWNGSAVSLVYSTYLGGSEDDWSQSIAVDSSGDAYLTGYTTSADFPVANALQGNLAGLQNAFVTELSWNGSALSLVYSTYLGGKLRDYGEGIAVDSSGDAYVTGFTSSSNFPTASPFQASLAGPFDTFISKLNWSGSNLSMVYSTFLGGNGTDEAYSIALDPSGNAYITGNTYSTNFPTLSPLQATLPNPLVSGFISGLNSQGSALLYSTYLGGNTEDSGLGIAADSSGSVYVTGVTMSSNFPTENPFQAKLAGPAGSVNAFVSKISPPSPGVSLSPNTLTFATQTVMTTSPSQSVLLTNTGILPLTISGITVSANFGLATTGTSCPYAGGPIVGTCTIDVTFTPPISGPITGSVMITDNNNGMPGSTQTISLMGTGFASLVVTASSGSMTYGGNVPVITPSYVGFLNGDTPASLTTQPTCTTTATNTSAVGSYPSTCMGAMDPKYMISYVAGSVSVNPAPLTITAPSATISQGSGIPSFTPTYSGFVNGQSASNLATQPACTTTASNPNMPGNYPITCSGAVDSNYAISYVAGTLTITASATQVSVSPSALLFNSQSVGTTSPPQQVTVMNQGNVALAFTNISVSGQYTQTNNCGGAIAPNNFCDISVTFVPTSGGDQDGALTLTDNATNSPQTVSLSGNGASAVNLSSYYNVYAIATPGTDPQDGGFDTSSYAYDSSQIGTLLSYQNVIFPLAAANAPDAVSNETVALPSGSYNQLYLLGGCAYGPQTNLNVVVTYTDGSSSTFTQSFSDWGHPSNFTGETTVIRMPNRITPGGGTQSGPWNVYGYTFNLTIGKTPASVSLPAKRNIVVLGIGLGGTN